MCWRGTARRPAGTAAAPARRSWCGAPRWVRRPVPATASTSAGSPTAAQQAPGVARPIHRTSNHRPVRIASSISPANTPVTCRAQQHRQVDATHGQPLVRPGDVLGSGTAHRVPDRDPPHLTPTPHQLAAPRAMSSGRRSSSSVTSRTALVRVRPGADSEGAPRPSRRRLILLTSSAPASLPASRPDLPRKPCSTPRLWCGVRDEGGQCVGDHAVALVGGVLVAQGGAGGRVAESGHEFGECGSG